jgi:hypothetical protein
MDYESIPNTERGCPLGHQGIANFCDDQDILRY